MKTLHISFFIALTFLFFGCSDKHLPLISYKQDVSLYIKEPKPLHVKIENFKSRYFMPWKINAINVEKDKARWANFVFKKKNSYYGENLLPWELDEVKAIIKNTNFSSFNTVLRYAITTKEAQTRNLPTDKPFFKDPSIGGEGYPFDYLQNTRLHVNTPLLISHYSLDGAWAFVQNPVSFGWIRSEKITELTSMQRDRFKNLEMLVITKDNTPIYTNNQKYSLHVKLGTLFPILKEDIEFFYSYLYKDEKVIHVRIPKSIASHMPLVYNKKNITHISSELLGEKYGWGGFLNNRDCSSMTKDFFTTFGVWLPRSSAGQKNSGEYISLKGLTHKEKEQMILKKGIAFLSLIYLPGHVMLYAGEKESRALAMHNVWGVKTLKNGKEARKIVGKSVISDLYLGANQESVDTHALLIAKAEGMVIKPDIPAYYVNPLTKAYPGITKVEQNRVYFDNESSLEYHDYKDKTFPMLLNSPSIKDTLSLKYKAFSPIKPPIKNDDSGRFRNEEMLKKLYGSTKEEIEKNLVKLRWVDGSSIYFNKKQNASKQLQKVMNDLQKLPKSYDIYLKNIAGTYNYRYISKTKRLSMHSFGVAIDLNVKYSAYWKWDKKYSFRNTIPKEIVDIFERYGFIWGGRWYHYDTMHFEYRPELFESID